MREWFLEIDLITDEIINTHKFEPQEYEHPLFHVIEKKYLDLMTAQKDMQIEELQKKVTSLEAQIASLTWLKN